VGGGGCGRGSRRVSRNRENPRSRLHGSRIRSDPGRGAIASRISIRADDGEEPQSPRRSRTKSAEEGAGRKSVGGGGEEGRLRASSVHLQSRAMRANKHACTRARALAGGELIILRNASLRALDPIITQHPRRSLQGGVGHTEDTNWLVSRWQLSIPLA